MTTKTKTAKKPVAKKTAAKPAAKKPAAKPATKKVTKPAAKPVAKAAAKKSVVKPAAKKPTAKPVAKKPAAKPAAKKATVKKNTTVKKLAPKKVAPKPAAPKSTAPESIKAMARAVEKALDLNKAKDIVAVDLTRKSSLADFMIVASGTSSRQVAALARYVEEAMLKAGSKRCRIEGLPQGDWVVVDSGDIIVHLFRPEVREFYQLEKLWSDEPGEANSRRSLA